MKCLPLLLAFLLSALGCGEIDTPHFVSEEGEDVGPVTVRRYQTWHDGELAFLPPEFTPVGTRAIQRLLAPIHELQMNRHRWAVLVTADGYAPVLIDRYVYERTPKFTLRRAVRFTITCESCQPGLFVAVYSNGVYHWRKMPETRKAAFDTVAAGSALVHAARVPSADPVFPVAEIHVSDHGQYSLWDGRDP